jgi:hypothetical protein
MAKFYLMLVFLLICVTGCTTSYRVHVNGFSEFTEPIKEKESIYVAMDPNSQNPIFDREIRDKIELLLKWYDYVPTETIKDADYRLVFQVGVGSHKVFGYMPLYHPSGFYHGGYERGYDFGFTTYIPYYYTLYDQWLVMKLFSLKHTVTSTTEHLDWIGEAMTDTNVADIRRAVNYPLVGCFEYFGVDTEKQVNLTIKKNDPRIVEITTAQ